MFFSFLSHYMLFLKKKSLFVSVLNNIRFYFYKKNTPFIFLYLMLYHINIIWFNLNQIMKYEVSLHEFNPSPIVSPLIFFFFFCFSITLLNSLSNLFAFISSFVWILWWRVCLYIYIYLYLSCVCLFIYFKNNIFFLL